MADGCGFLLTGFSSENGGGDGACFLSKIGGWTATGRSGTEATETIPGGGAKPLVRFIGGTGRCGDGMDLAACAGANAWGSRSTLSLAAGFNSGMFGRTAGAERLEFGLATALERSDSLSTKAVSISPGRA